MSLAGLVGLHLGKVEVVVPAAPVVAHPAPVPGPAQAPAPRPVAPAAPAKVAAPPQGLTRAPSEDALPATEVALWRRARHHHRHAQAEGARLEPILGEALELPPGSGYVRLESAAGLQVWVDGKPRGRTPLAGLVLPAGRHVIEVRNPLDQFRSFEVQVADGEQNRLTTDLE
jgi:hypothetical protein